MQALLQRLRKQCLFEVRRYSRYRYGKLAGFLLMSALLTLTPLILASIIPTLQVWFSDRIVYVILFSTSIVLTQSLYNAAFYYIYTGKYPFFEQYRVNPDKPWPWETDPEKFKTELYRSLSEQALNMFVLMPLLIYLEAYLEIKTVEVDASLTPSLQTMIVQLFAMLLMEDFLFFSSHMILHHKALYPFHKFHHDDKITTTLTSFRAQVVENLAQIVFPTIIYMKIASYYAPLHVSTVVIWQVFRLCESNNSHCGYNFSWTLLGVLPFATSEGYHDFHHSHNVGNYASTLRIWDTIFDTNHWFMKYDQARQAKKTSQVDADHKEE